MVRDQTGRSVRQIAVEAIIIQVEAWYDADRITDLEPRDTFANGRNRTRSLVARAGGKPGLRNVLARAKHHFGAVQSQCMNADLNLAFAGGWDLDLLDS